MTITPHERLNALAQPAPGRIAHRLEAPSWPSVRDGAVAEAKRIAQTAVKHNRDLTDNEQPPSMTAIALVEGVDHIVASRKAGGRERRVPRQLREAIGQDPWGDRGPLGFSAGCRRRGSRRAAGRHHVAFGGPVRDGSRAACRVEHERHVRPSDVVGEPACRSSAAAPGGRCSCGLRHRGHHGQLLEGGQHCRDGQCWGEHLRCRVHARVPGVGDSGPLRPLDVVLAGVEHLLRCGRQCWPAPTVVASVGTSTSPSSPP